jgi:hypothetical protein
MIYFHPVTFRMQHQISLLVLKNMTYIYEPLPLLEYPLFLQDCRRLDAPFHPEENYP